MKNWIINQKSYDTPQNVAPAKPRLLRTAKTAKGAWVFADGHVYFVESPKKQTAQTGASGAGSGTVTSPMPGKIFRVLIKPGDTVTPGQDLLVLEAMKMEHTLTAPVAGKVAKCDVKVGDLVELGQVLAEIA